MLSQSEQRGLFTSRPAFLPAGSQQIAHRARSFLLTLFTTISTLPHTSLTKTTTLTTTTTQPTPSHILTPHVRIHIFHSTLSNPSTAHDDAEAFNPYIYVCVVLPLHTTDTAYYAENLMSFHCGFPCASLFTLLFV